MEATKCKHNWEKSNNENVLPNGREVRYCHHCKSVQTYNPNDVEPQWRDAPANEYEWLLDWILWEVGR